MHLKVRTTAFIVPRRITAAEAADLNNRGFFDDAFLLMAKNWRVDAIDDDFEELGTDELDDVFFVEDFAKATLEMWLR